MSNTPQIEGAIECLASEAYTTAESEIAKRLGPGDAIDLLRYVVWLHESSGDWIGTRYSNYFRTSKAAEALGWDADKVITVWQEIEQITILAIWDFYEDEEPTSTYGPIICLGAKHYRNGLLVGGWSSVHTGIIDAIRGSEIMKNIRAQFEGTR
tara:strand:- start:37 stop:498 length:462 start_codon:yes stop_codon:yes gene_type:complete